MKNKKTKSNNKILYNTLFDECKITTKEKKSQKKKTIKTIVTHYKEHGFIKDYNMGKDGLTIYF